MITVSITRQSLEFEGRPAILGVIRDVTEFHNIKEALREQEDLFHLLIEGIKDYGIFMLDAGGRVLTWNQGAERNTGYAAEEVIGRHWSCFYTPEDVRLGKPDAALIIAESKGRCEEEGLRERKDGTRYHTDCVLTALRDSAGRLRGFACIARDVSERRILEQRILEAAEREQTRIGQDLHDSLGQRLTGIGLLARALEDKLSALKAPETEQAALIRKQLVEAAEQTRRLARGLYSADLEANRLAPALRQLLDDARLLFGVSGVLDCAADVPVQPPIVSAQLYHIAQEAIHNAVRHGHAKKIRVALASSSDGTLLSIRDDGSGLPSQLPNDGGMGLRIMRYRAGLIGGQVTVSRDPSGGTVVSCLVNGADKNDSISGPDGQRKR